MAMAADQVKQAYRTYSGELFGFAQSSLGDAGHAEEAVQECFLRAWRFREYYESERASDRTWLFAILRNVITDISRAEARRASVPSGSLLEEPAEGGPVPGDRSPYETVLLRFELKQAMNEIGEQHRLVILEICLLDRSQVEVAEALDVPEGTVKSRLHYGLRALRGALEEFGYEL